MPLRNITTTSLLRVTKVVRHFVILNEKVLLESQRMGLGAQFGGKYFAHDVRIIRLPRHGASCPVGMGVSCSADRNIKAKINKDGIWIEKMETNRLVSFRKNYVVQAKVKQFKLT